MALVKDHGEPLPPLGDIQRRGQLRVFTALPIFSNGEVIGIVTASRTGLVVPVVVAKEVDCGGGGISVMTIAWEKSA